jgi:stress response protein SCP2
MDLVAGANRALPAGPVAVAVTGPYDLSALVLGQAGRVAGDADFVFYNQPTAPGVQLTPGAVTVDPSALRRGATRVVVLASPDDLHTPFVRLPAPDLTVRSRGQVVARFRPCGLASETVVQLVEFYQRGEMWKVRALGQGYADGLAGLARDFGVTVDDDGADDVSTVNGAAGRGGPPPGGSGSAPTSLVHEVVAATNRERAASGLAPLALEARLGTAAQAHAEDMVARRFFSHDSPDGRSVADRVLAAGYLYSVVAENLAAGQRSAAEVVEGWMNSPGHRANILSRDVRQIGIGFTEGGEYGTTWVQVFGTPR